MNLQNINTMSSREIAELTGKRHSDVLRDTRVMLEQLGRDERKFASIYKDKPLDKKYGGDSQTV